AGGFGGGGGAGPGGSVFGGPGSGGTFGGDADGLHGGGGGALGGAIFSDGGDVTIRNSTFTGNSVARGNSGGGHARNGADAGGAIFAVDGVLAVSNSTVTGGETTGNGAGIVMYRSSRSGYSATLQLTNTIVAADVTTSQECLTIGAVAASGSGNLYTNNANCPGEAASGDPQLGALQVEAPGLTPTMAIDANSPAFDAGDDGTCEAEDQRTVSRPQSLHCDIGAYEFINPSADLAVAKTTLGPAIAGADLGYVIDVHNNGPTAAENVTVVDTLPAGTTFVSITGSGGFACTGTGPVTCTNALMREGATALLTLTVHIPATAADGTTITNSVTVASSTTPDPVPANNAASVTTTVSTRADVSVVKTGPSQPIAGADVAYSLVVANQGPSVARNVSWTDTLPVGTTFRSLSTPAGWACSTPAIGSAGTVTCTTSGVAPMTTAAMTLTVRLAASAADGATLCNTATVTTDTIDPVATNNGSQACGTVRTLADLRVTESATTTGKPGKGTATFTITLTNLGPSDSQGIALAATSSLFSGPPPSTMASAGGTCTVAGSTVTCTWTTLAYGASAQIVISVPWRSSVGQVCTTATVTSGTSDPNAANNTASACVGKR
ncbi:MAG TPA: DUF11 domain-containing protein, partial [Candidatus Limnocylindrales bacterium]|nr:DUF11 domain-containing protein [Candidatus Limnocylindrales bacterium]